MSQTTESPASTRNIAQLREEFSRVHGEAQSLIDGAIKDGKELDDAAKKANEARFARLDQIKTIIDQEQRLAGLAFSNGRTQTETEMPGCKETERAEGLRKAFGRNPSPYETRFAKADGSWDETALRREVNQFARTGQASPELFTVSTGTGSGAYLPKDILGPVTVRRNYNAWRAAAVAYGGSVMELSEMASFSLPVADDTSNTGQSQSETATSGTSQDPTDASLSFTPRLYSSKQFWYSNTMVLGQSFDVMAFTQNMAVKRLEKIRESAWTTTITTNGTVGKTCAAAGAITYAEIIAFEHSLNVAYRSDAAFVLSDNAYQIIRGITDSYGRPIFDEDPTNVFMGKIHGKPVLVCDYLSSMGANNLVGAFASADALKILDIQNSRLARYQNVPTNPDQIGFEWFENGDFNFIPNGLRLLKCGAS